MVVTRGDKSYDLNPNAQESFSKETPGSSLDIQQLLKLMTEQNDKMTKCLETMSNLDDRIKNLELSKSENIPVNTGNPTIGRSNKLTKQQDHPNADDIKPTLSKPKMMKKQSFDDIADDLSSIIISEEEPEIEVKNSLRQHMSPPNITIEKFTGKCSFQVWLKKFNAYCKINNVHTSMMHEYLILMLDEEPACDANRIELNSYQTLSTFLANKYTGQYSFISANHELELLTAKPVRKPEELDSVCQKINNIIEILEENKPAKYVLQRKVEALAKIVPLELRSKILLTASVFPSFDVAVSSTKRAWNIDYKADIERQKGNSLSRTNYFGKTRTSRKYCSKCRTTTHNTSECRHLAKTYNTKKERINKVEDNESILEEENTDDEDKEFIYQMTHKIEENIKRVTEKGLIGTHILVNDQSCVAVVDPGATCTIIDKDCAKRLQIKVKETEGRQVNVLSNTATVYKVKSPIRLNILGEELILSNRVYVNGTSFNDSNYQVILGNNALKKVDGKIETMKGTFTLNTTNKPPEIQEMRLSLDNNNVNFVLESENNHELEEKLRNELSVKFSDVIAQHEYDVGKGLVETPEQEFYKEMIPKKIKHYPVPLNDRPELDKIVSNYIKNDIIEVCDSNYVAPVMILNKPPDSTGIKRKRFVLDVRETNSITKYINYEPPTLQSILSSIRKYNYASNIDLCSGFLQLKIPESIRDRFAFQTTQGIFRFKRLVQGAKNSPGIFQRTMERIFSSMRDNMLIYQDDLLIVSEGNEVKHTELLHQFFTIARTHGLKVNFNKSKFFRRIVSFLGWDITPEGVKPSAKSVENIMRFKLPTIKNFAQLSSKLYELSSGRNGKIELKGDNLKDYLTIVETLYKQPLLYHANPKKPYILTCDASNQAVGATLTQEDDSGIERPISFFSCKLPSVKKPRSATYNELYAVKRALQFNKFLLIGAYILIRSDHRPLERLIENTQEKRFFDLVESINSYNCKIEYIKGSKNNSADCLSRLPHNDTSEDEEVNVILRKRIPKIYNEKKVMKKNFKFNSLQVENNEIPLKKRRGRPRKECSKQATDTKELTTNNENIHVVKKRGRPKKHSNKSTTQDTSDVDENKSIINTNPEPIKPTDDIPTHDILNNDRISKLNFNLKLSQDKDPEIVEARQTLKYDGKEAKEINGILCVKIPSDEGGKDWIPVLPSDLDTIKLMFEICHSLNGHFCLEKSLKFLKINCYIKKGRKYFEDLYKSCKVCAQVNSPMEKHCKMKTVEYTQPFENLSVDVCGPFQPVSQHGNRYVIVFIDSLTRYTIAYPIKQYDYQNIVEVLQDLIFTHGAPQSIRCDNAPNFKSKLWTEALKAVNIRLEHASEYHSRGSTLAERSLRNIQDGLKKLVKEDATQWDKYIKPYCYFYNINICQSTNKSPYFLHYLRHPHTMLNDLLKMDAKYKVDINRPLTELVEYAKRAYEATKNIIKKNSELRKIHVNPKRILNENIFKVGSKVYAKLPDLSRGRKLAKKWKGPYTIIKMEDRIAHIVLDDNSKKSVRKLHVDKLKKFP